LCNECNMLKGQKDKEMIQRWRRERTTPGSESL
jgi:hypothetical protein